MHAATESHTDFPILKRVFILGLASPQLPTAACLTCLQICKRSGKLLQKILSCVESALAFKRKTFLCRARVPVHLHSSAESAISGFACRVATNTMETLHSVKFYTRYKKWKNNGSDNDSDDGYDSFCDSFLLVLEQFEQPKQAEQPKQQEQPEQLVRTTEQPRQPH